MYDLPMQTEEELREYQRFRKNIIGKGYYQLQKSVYIINSKNIYKNINRELFWSRKIVTEASNIFQLKFLY